MSDNLLLLGAGGGGGTIVSGLAARWKLDEPSGTTAADASGNGNNGTYTGTTTSASVPSQISSFIARSRSFNGTSDLVTIPDAPTLDFSGGLSICGWLNCTSLTLNPIVLDKTFSTSYYLQLISTGAIEVGGSSAANGFLDSPAGSIVVSTWTHVAGTYNIGTSTITIYTNGTVAGSAGGKTAGIGVNSSTIILGRRNSTASNFYPGLMSDLRVYNRALSAAEVALIAAGTG